MWDTLKVMYGNKKNPSRVFKIYEHLFELKQGVRVLWQTQRSYWWVRDASTCCTLRSSRYRNFYLVWVLHYDPRCGVKYWEEIVFPCWLPPSRELCGSLLDPRSNLHHPLSSLSWFPVVAEIVVVAAILEDEDMDSLEVEMDLMETDRVPLNDPAICIMDVAITFPKSTGRNLDVLSGRNYLILVIFLPRVVLRVFHLLFLTLPRLYYRRSMIVEFSQCTHIPLLKTQDIRLRSLISYDRY